MANFFESFRQGVGNPSGATDNQAEVALRFAQARHNSMNAGGAKRSSAAGEIARPIQNGRHQFSDQVLTGYEIAGIEIDEEVLSLTAELDNLALSSQAISKMDNATRQRYINRGMREFDETTILSREAELQQMIMDRARPVLVENEALDRQLKRIQVRRAGETGGTDMLSVDGKRRDEQYRSQLQDMTFSELNEVLNAGGIEGIPRPWLAKYTMEIGKVELENKTLAEALKGGASVNAPLFGTATGTRRTASTRRTTGSGGAGGSDPNLFGEKDVDLLRHLYTPDQISNLVLEGEQALSQRGPNDNTPIMVPLPGLDQSIPLATIIQAVEAEATSSSSSKGGGNAARNKTLYTQAMLSQEVFTSQLTHMGGKLDLTVPAQASVQAQYALVSEALEAGDFSGAQNALKSAQDAGDKIIESFINNRPEEQRSFLTDIHYLGAPQSSDAVASFLTGVVTNEVVEQFGPDSPYTMVAQLVGTEIQSFEGQVDAEQGALDVASLVGGSTARRETEAQRKRMLAERLLDAADTPLYSKVFNAGVGDKLLTTGLREAVLGRMTALRAQMESSAGGQSDQRSLQEATILAEAAEVIYGSDWKRGELANTFMRDFPLKNSKDQPFLDSSGEQVNIRTISVSALLGALQPYQEALKASGSDYQLMSAVVEGIRKNSDALVREISPGNDPNKQAYFYTVNGRFRTGTRSANEAALEVINHQASLLGNAITNAQSDPVTIGGIIENSRDSVVEHTLISKRAQEIISNWDTMYNAELGGRSKEQLGSPTQPRNIVAVQRAAAQQATIELRQQMSTGQDIIGSQVLKSDVILQSVLGDLSND